MCFDYRYIRHVRWTCLFYAWYLIYTIVFVNYTYDMIVNTKYSVSQKIVRACSMFYPYEGYRSVTPLDAARVNRTIFHNHSVH